MDKLNNGNEQLPTNEHSEKKGIKDSTKKSLKKLFSALVIAGMISGTAVAKETVSSYSQIQKLTSKMKEGDKITLQVKSGSAESFIKKLEDNGFEVKKGKNGELIITKVVNLGSDEQYKKLDKKDRLEAQLETLKAQLENQKVKSETLKNNLENLKVKLENLQAKKHLEQHKKHLALANYGENLAKILLDTLRGIQNNTLSETDIIDNLKIIKKDTYAGNIVSSENNRQGRLESLNRIKILYKNNLKITSLINKIEKRLNHL